LAVVAIAIHAIDCSKQTLMEFALRSLFLSLGPDPLSRSGQEPCRGKPNGQSAISARLPLPIVQPASKFVVLHFQFGFWALLPLRIRQSLAVLRPRMLRCSLGIRLSKDFSLPVPSPSSRAFHSQTCADVDLTTEHRSVSQQFALQGD
jgi:hypothetical protein